MYAYENNRHSHFQSHFLNYVNKQNISLTYKDFVGHTEYLLKSFSELENLMLLCNQNLKIATVTNHIPISKVSTFYLPSENTHK